MGDIIVTTGNDIPSKKIVQIIGVVQGSTVRARNIGRDIGAGFKSLIGGEVKTYTEMTKNSREEAYNRMVNEALDLKLMRLLGLDLQRQWLCKELLKCLRMELLWRLDRICERIIL